MPLAQPIAELKATGPHPGGRLHFRPDIEGLRAIAILLVVAFHSGIPGVAGGFIGVDVFFVLSGYLITELLTREVDQTGTLRFGRFYARRARRLLPASALMLVFTLAVGYALLSPLEVVRLSLSAIATAGYMSNMWFLVQFTDYFGPGVSANPLLHTWSLAVEEQFYLVWPMLVVLCMRRKRPRKVLLYTLSGVGVLSVAASVWLTYTHQPIAFFSAPTRAWEFTAGGLATLIPNGRFSRFFEHPIAPWLGAAFIAASGIWLTPAYGFPGIVALVPVAGTVLILLAGKVRPSGAGLFALLDTPVLQWLGSVSYSWYLWHWPVLVFGHILWPRRGAMVSVALVLLSLVLAWAAHSFIENPIRFSPRLAQRPAYSLVLGALLTVGGLIAGVICHRLGQRWAESPKEAAYLQATNNRLDSCMAGFHHDQVSICSFGPIGPKTVVLFGDSHAEQWLPALIRVANANDFHLITLLKASCPTAMVPIYNPRLEREESECGVWRRNALTYISRLKPSLVLISNSAGYVQRPSFTDPYARLSGGQWEDGTRATLDILNRSASSVVLLRDTPRPDVDVPVCLSRSSIHPEIFPSSTCDVRKDRALAPSVWHLETSAAKDFANVSTLDLTDIFCNSGQCLPVVNGIVVYRDTNHMSAAFAVSLAPVLAQKLSSVMAGQRALTVAMSSALRPQHLRIPGSDGSSEVTINGGNRQ